MTPERCAVRDLIKFIDNILGPPHHSRSRPGNRLGHVLAAGKQHAEGRDPQMKQKLSASQKASISKWIKEDPRMARTRDSIMKDLRSAQKQLLAAKARGNREKVSHHQARLAELERSAGRQMPSSFIGIGRMRCGYSLSQLCDLLVHIFIEPGKAFVQLLHEHVRQRILLIGAKACQCSGHDLSPGIGLSGTLPHRADQ